MPQANLITQAIEQEFHPGTCSQFHHLLQNRGGRSSNNIMHKRTKVIILLIVEVEVMKWQGKEQTTRACAQTQQSFLLKLQYSHTPIWSQQLQTHTRIHTLASGWFSLYYQVFTVLPRHAHSTLAGLLHALPQFNKQSTES